MQIESVYAIFIGQFYVNMRNCCIDPSVVYNFVAFEVIST